MPQGLSDYSSLAIGGAAKAQESNEMSDIDILISEVGPRDGLQSIQSIMPTDAKKPGSRPKLPLVCGKSRLVPSCRPNYCRSWPTRVKSSAGPGKSKGSRWPPWYPTSRAPKTPSRRGAHKITLPLSVSETHSKANLRKTHAQVLDEVRKIVELLDSLPAGKRPHFEGRFVHGLWLHPGRPCTRRPGG